MGTSIDKALAEYVSAKSGYFEDYGFRGRDLAVQNLREKKQAVVRAVRREALEDAASLVDGCHPKATHRGIATAIRALIEAEETGNG